MLQRPFGTSPLSVSTLGFGAGHIDAGQLDDRSARHLVEEALALGVTFFDTARGYGASEERLGRYVAGCRDEVVLSTKVGYDVPGHRDWSAGAVTHGVERALRTMGTDRIDVVFLHSCPLDVLRRGEVVEALLRAQVAGKVRVVGYSGENAELAWAAERPGLGALQTSLNLADQHSLRRVVPRAAQAGLGVVAKRPLANAAWRHEHRPAGVYGETYWLRLRRMGLEPRADDWAATAVRFSAFSPGVATAIVGTSSVAHLRSAAEAVARGPLPAEERRRWEQAFAPYAEEWPGEV